MTKADFSKGGPLNLNSNQQKMIKAAPGVWRAVSIVASLFFLPVLFVGGAALSVVQVVRSQCGTKSDADSGLSRRAFLCPFSVLCATLIGIFSPTRSFRFLVNCIPLLTKDVKFVADKLNLDSALKPYDAVRGSFFPDGEESSEIDAFMARQLPFFIGYSKHAEEFLRLLATSLGLNEESVASDVVDRAWKELATDKQKWGSESPIGTQKEFLRQCRATQRYGAVLGSRLVEFLKANARKYEEQAGADASGLGAGFVAVLDDIFSRKGLAALMAEKFSGNCAELLAPQLNASLEIAVRNLQSVTLPDAAVKIKIPEEGDLVKVFTAAIKKDSSMKTFPAAIVKAILMANKTSIPASIRSTKEFKDIMNTIEDLIRKQVAESTAKSHPFVIGKAIIDYLHVKAGNVQKS
ncbi:MAG: hypothetical protein LBH53_00365 [Puniceicoccales bacterium]|nr:hypothetical protein [Puniceicoccales bacterium]